ncbi:phage terminase, large subunit [Escherichia coli]|nr:phage terminase, large subunit [Escherichia coli]
MKTHVEPTIRDIPSLLALAPWYGKKHRDNTLTMKRFSNGRGFWCLGGKAAKNYREKSVDVAGYDELAAFDEDIEQEPARFWWRCPCGITIRRRQSCLP